MEFSKITINQSESSIHCREIFSKSCLIRFGIRFPEICFEKLINFELSSQIYIKIKEIDYLLKNQLFLFDYMQKIQLT